MPRKPKLTPDPGTADAGRVSATEPDHGSDHGEQQPVNGDRGEAGKPEAVPDIPGAIDPSTYAIPDQPEPAKRGRPRKSGTSNPQAAAGTQNLADSKFSLEEILFTIHGTLAMMSDVPECAIDEKEAKRMSDATAELMKHYPVAVDPKKMAFVSWAFVTGGIYGKHFFAYRARIKREAAGNSAPAAAPAAASRPHIVPAAPATGGPEALAFSLDVSRGARTPADLWNANGVLTSDVAPAL